MTDLIVEAERRIGELEVELNELRQFLTIAGKLAAGSTVVRSKVRRSPAAHSAPESSENADFPGSTPREIVFGLYEILSEEGKTLTRNDLLDRLRERDIVVPGMYPNKNLGTILWRNQRLFEHLRGEGYRWTKQPFKEPSAG